MKDIIIIGQGPAGLSAALYACRANHSALVIGKGGGALEKAHKIENYFGLEQPLSGKELLKIGKAQARSLGATLVDDEVVNISAKNGAFFVDTIRDHFEGKTIILAAGAPRKTPEIQRLPDFEGRGVSYCAVCDAFFFRGKKVGILGSGSYALHELEFLLPMVNTAVLLTNGDRLEVSAKLSAVNIWNPRVGEASATLPLQNGSDANATNPALSHNQPTAMNTEPKKLNRSGEFGNTELKRFDRSDESGFSNRIITDGKTGLSYKVITDKIVALSGKDLLESVTFENGKTMELDGLFVALGTAGALDLARKLGVAVQTNAIAVDKNMATNVPGFFAAGDCTGGLLQVSTAVAEGAKAAMSAIAYLRSHAK